MRLRLASAVVLIVLTFAGTAKAASVVIRINRVTDTQWSVVVDDYGNVAIAAISFFMAGATGFTFAPTLNVSVPDSVNRLNGPGDGFAARSPARNRAPTLSSVSRRTGPASVSTVLCDRGEGRG